MVLTQAGLSVLRYVAGKKATSHLVRAGGYTVCGLKAWGSRWKFGQKFDPAQDCKRCARVARRGIALLLQFCPKCASDTGASLALMHNRECANCGNRWT